MKRTQFKEMVKEIIKEVISEIENVNGDVGPSPKSTADRNASKQKWAGMKQDLEKMKQEPKHQAALSALQKKNGDQPLDEMGKQNAFPKSDAPGTEDGKSSDQKIASRQAAWKSWGDKKQGLDALKNEPSHQAKLKALRQKNSDEPLSN